MGSGCSPPAFSLFLCQIEGDGDVEAGALPGDALRGDVAAVRAGDGQGDRQAQAGRIPVARTADLVVSLEDMGEVLRGDSLARILHSDGGKTLPGSAGEADRAAGGGNIAGRCP